MGILMQKVRSNQKGDDNLGAPIQRGERTIPQTDVEKAEEDLRILQIEKEIIGFALSRFDAAESEGKITKDDRIQLLDKYNAEMNDVEKEIKKNEMIIKLYELEGTQTNLIQMFYEKLDEINNEISTIRTSLDLSVKKSS